MTSPRVILASSSPRRRELLTMIGIRHDVMPADIDESYHAGETPDSHAQRLAIEKAQRVAATSSDALVVGADTIVVVDGEVLGKPRSEADAAGMLRRLSGRTHRVVTAVAVARSLRVESAVERADVTFRALTEPVIAAYIATREPMDKAGAYGIQGYGATIVERIDGDFFTVMGLPLARLITLIERFGVAYDFRSLTEAAVR